MGQMELEACLNLEAALISAAGYISQITPCKISQKGNMLQKPFDYYHDPWEVKKCQGTHVAMLWIYAKCKVTVEIDY